MRDLLWGRELLLEEIPENIRHELLKCGTEVKKRSGWYVKNHRYYCRRCGSSVSEMETSFCTCGEDCGYCRNCLQMGRVKKCSNFYSLSLPKITLPETQYSLAWEGVLSKQQQLASDAIVEAIKNNKKILLYAVTGAGKTEMLFEGILTALNLGKRVCIASPRIDVCLELAPRLKEAFSSVEIAVLYGDSDVPYKFTPLTIATTHQLLRFYHGFDVLIIDEVDAFPFHRNDVLNYGAKKCVKKEHTLIYLTATPSDKVRKMFSCEETLVLPARYHGHPLPEPRLLWSGEWQESLLNNKLTKHKIIQQIKTWLELDQRFLIFCSNIEWMKKFENKLHQVFPEQAFTSVSSVDEKRKEKVMKMREDKYRFMLTTTILERGVTFPNINIMVIGAEDSLFDEAALVQIAGRAGRSFRYPTGEVIFYHYGRTRALNKAAARIRYLNHTARKRGLLRD